MEIIQMKEDRLRPLIDQNKSIEMKDKKVLRRKEEWTPVKNYSPTKFKIIF